MLIGSATPVLAEKPVSVQHGLGAAISAGELQVTPEMWFYDQQMRRFQDPKMAVHEQAAYHAMQRQHRIESMRWFGLSNSRPQVSTDPFHADYSPRWTANSVYFPGRWNGANGPAW
jgi:hypothetical protein